ncbi:MAG: ATP-dependent DNA helicase [Firmicutes bacterium]|nr:ATP-dependent DNA helicase [Bacillota bacterium]
MGEREQIKISVRNLVEFILRSGDLDSRFMGSSRAVEGTKAHQKVQKTSDDNYNSEVHLKYKFQYGGFDFRVEGRADGIIIEEDESVIIDEIKSTTRSLDTIDEEYNPLHWAQAKCYGYIYSKDNNLENIKIQLTYFQLETEDIKRIHKDYSFGELEEFFYDLIEKYLVWAKLTNEWTFIRNKSIKELEFPFSKYRKGQRKLAVAVYRTVSEEKRLFAQAPTGIGKTISTLFPAIKAIGEGHSSKIFYLTAKTITRQVAEDTIRIMSNNYLKFKSITLTAKDKICFKEESNCNPDYCEFARGHFNRANEAILDILKNEDMIVREKVEEYARKHKICPFEFSLDLAIWTDCVICDYNYAFDPRVYLKRFFSDNNGDYTFLIDEAHNLVDRSREMFSSELYKEHILEAKRIMKDKNKRISKALNKINSFMLKIKKECNEEGYYIQEKELEEVYPLLRKFIRESEEWLVSNERVEGYEKVLELYFQILSFLRISEIYDERYVTYVEQQSKDVKIKLFCVDPSYLLREAIKRGRSAIFFSATLTPLEYFRNTLGGDEDDYIMALSSPFKEENMRLLISSNVSTKYRNREKSYSKIADYIYKVANQKVGNYMVFFPSYAYMNQVYDIFRENYSNIFSIKQSSMMSEEEREDFLNNFIPDSKESLIGFAVLGGIFSEGIDLTGERLSGAVIVGVGLPKICLERNIIKDFFNEKNSMGFEYSYTYPGMNKVLQAAGRVIRTEKDRGIILLIDERFMYSTYQQLFPDKWYRYRNIRNEKDLERKLESFWNI